MKKFCNLWPRLIRVLETVCTPREPVVLQGPTESLTVVMTTCRHRITQHLQYLCLLPPTEAGGVTGAK